MSTMHSPHPRRIVSALCAVALSLTAATAYSAPPAPSEIPVPIGAGADEFRYKLESKQFKVEQLKNQLDSLDRELEIAVESYNGASEDLTRTRADLQVTKEDLAAAEDALITQQSLLQTRVVDMYQSGMYNPAEVLLSAHSIPEFISRLQFIREITTADADLAGELRTQRDTIAGNESELERAEIEAAALEFTLHARKLEIEQRIADREALLRAAEADLSELLDSDEARAAGVEYTLWREILAGVSRTGVKIETGSPVETALAYHGVPYVWGGASPSGFDCSGLTMYVMEQHGVSLPHHAADQVLLGERVVPADLRPGDLVFFGSPVHHVGMYIGGGYFIHAPRRNDYVKVSVLAERSDFSAARRYPWSYRVGPPKGVAGSSPVSEVPVSP